jgi:hypothetical protein
MLIACIVTGPQALKEFQLLIHTLEQWEPAAEVFVLSDTTTGNLLDAVKSRIRIRIRKTLDAYKGLTRKDMEARSGRTYPTMWHDFMIEKVAVIKWVFEERDEVAVAEGVWFLDSDITLLSPLPTFPTNIQLALSPHYIRAGDEARYGHFNGGMLWLRNPALLDVWRRATHGSRFYEQAALEDVWKAVAAEARLELGQEVNFGWWRYLQSADPPPVIQGRLGYNRRLVGSGLTYGGVVLQSVHTHWEEASEFNGWLRGRLEMLARSHPPAKVLLQHLNRLFNNAAASAKNKRE